ncbi:hypothetical protein OS493_021829 [Desmophyllum pertusum]|uniref:Uncharacterized protein n=1 Tax=Desmophyllum pertusum TaxID=174260 RepID=A0A9X0D254_9CNID|nr:hypothetical protein OS493_021829 [Desmophyllum pertusum]
MPIKMKNFMKILLVLFVLSMTKAKPVPGDEELSFERNWNDEEWENDESDWDEKEWENDEGDWGDDEDWDEEDDEGNGTSQKTRRIGTRKMTTRNGTSQKTRRIGTRKRRKMTPQRRRTRLRKL